MMSTATEHPNILRYVAPFDHYKSCNPHQPFATLCFLSKCLRCVGLSQKTSHNSSIPDKNSASFFTKDSPRFFLGHRSSLLKAVTNDCIFFDMVKGVKKVNVTPHPSVINFIGYIICSICTTKVSKIENLFQNLTFCGKYTWLKVFTASEGGATMQNLTNFFLYLVFIFDQQLYASFFNKDVTLKIKISIYQI